MARIEGEIVIGRPVNIVFDFVADQRNEPRYNSRMVRRQGHRGPGRERNPVPLGRGVHGAHPAGGPYLFIVELPETQAPEIQPLVGVSDASAFEPPHAGTVAHPFTGRHWGVAEMLLRDPDGRHVSVQAAQPTAAKE